MSGDFSKVNKLIADLEKLFNTVGEELALHEIQKAGLSIDALLDEIPPAVDAKVSSEYISLSACFSLTIFRIGCERSSCSE